MPAIEAVTDWFADLQPDVVVFQEIFYSGLCPGIPADKKDGFVCEDWVDGGPTVAQVILNIDHVVSDVFTGSCYAPGATPGYPKVYENVLFDHKPLVCTIGDL